MIIAPDGGDAWAPAKPRPDETLIRALARAHRWKRMLEEGKYRSAAEIAEAEGVTRSFVNRLLRLTLLAPDIVEAILDGRQPKAMQLEELTTPFQANGRISGTLFCQATASRGEKRTPSPTVFGSNRTRNFSPPHLLRRLTTARHPISSGPPLARARSFARCSRVCTSRPAKVSVHALTSERFTLGAHFCRTGATRLRPSWRSGDGDQPGGRSLFAQVGQSINPRHTCHGS